MFRRRYLGIPLLAALSVAVSLMLLTIKPSPGAIVIGIADTTITLASDQR